MLVSFALFAFLTYSLGTSTYVHGHDSLNKRAATLFEKCPQNPSTNTAYHISLIGLHTHANGGPPATECGYPGGSPHFNLHFDQCIDINCNGCNFPFVTYSQYIKLVKAHLIQLNNWHAFAYTSTNNEECLCLWDSKTGATLNPPCSNNTSNTDDIKNLLLDYVDNMQQAAGDVWLELVDLPWQFKVLVITAAVGAFVALLSEIIAALAAAGIVIAADVIAEIGAALIAALAARFGIPLP